MVETSERVHPVVLNSTAASDSTTRISRRSWCANCFRFTAVLSLLVMAVVVSILCSTVFKFRTPIIRVSNLHFNKQNLFTVNYTTNVTVTAVVSMRNPNRFASFAFGNTTTALFYRGAAFGQAWCPAGTAAARRTARMRVNGEIVPSRIISRPDFNEDLTSGVVNVSTFTRIDGRVRMLAVEKRVFVTMNCSVAINVSSWKALKHKCRRTLKL